MTRVAIVAAVIAAGGAVNAGAQNAEWARPLEASNMRIVGHNDLNGKGNGGEGLALTQYRDGRRVLFLAHESAPDLLQRRRRHRHGQAGRDHPGRTPSRPTSAAIHSDCRARRSSSHTRRRRFGLPNGGMRVFDVADPAHPKEIAFFDTSGPHSRGVHFVGFVRWPSTRISRLARKTSSRSTPTTISS